MSDEEATRRWAEERFAREEAEQDAETGDYNPPKSDPARAIYDSVYKERRARIASEAKERSIREIAQKDATRGIYDPPPSEDDRALYDEVYRGDWIDPDANKQQQSQTKSNTVEFSMSGCIVSFLITLGIAITGGLAVPFIIGIFTVGHFGTNSIWGFVCAGVIYLGLCGVIWRAIYKVMQRRAS